MKQCIASDYINRISSNFYDARSSFCPNGKAAKHPLKPKILKRQSYLLASSQPCQLQKVEVARVCKPLCLDIGGDNNFLTQLTLDLARVRVGAQARCCPLTLYARISASPLCRPPMQTTHHNIMTRLTRESFWNASLLSCNTDCTGQV